MSLTSDHKRRPSQTKNLLSIEHISNIGRDSDQRSAGVDSSTSVLQLEDLIAELDLLELNLPVRLPPYGNVVKLSSEGAGVNSTEDSLTPIVLRVADAEREDGAVEQTGINHLVEGRLDVVDGDGVICETKDTVESRCGVGSEGQGVINMGRSRYEIRYRRGRWGTHLPKAKVKPGSWVASAKRIDLVVKSPIVKSSWETTPDNEPEPYWISKADPFALYVDEESWSYLAWKKQEMDVQALLGTHRLEDLWDGT